MQIGIGGDVMHEDNIHYDILLYKLLAFGKVRAQVLCCSLLFVIMGYTGGAYPVFGQTKGPLKVCARNISINYHISNVKRRDVKRVELWYSYGKTGPWQLYGYDYDKVSPVDFEVPRAGYWRFLVVVIDRWGRCSLDYSTSSGKKVIKTGNVNPLDKSSLYTGDIPAGTPAQVGLWVSFPSDKAKITKTSSNTNVTSVTGTTKAANNINNNRGVSAWGTKSVLPPNVGVLPDLAASSSARKHSRTVSALRSGTKVDNVGNGNVVSQPTKTQLVGQYLRRGNFYFARQEWPQAAQAYRKAVNIDSKCIDARLFLAKVLYKQNRFTEAQQQFDICLRENPALRDAIMYDIAQIQISANQPARALATLQTLVKDNPQDYQAWLVLGDTAHKLKKSQLALQAWRKAAMSGLPVIARIAKQRLIEIGDK